MDQKAMLLRLQSVRTLMQRTMERSQEVASDLNTVDSRFQRISERLPKLEAAMEPIRKRSNEAMALCCRLNEATALAALFLEKYSAMHALEGTIKSAPKEDISGYLLAVTQLHELLLYVDGNKAMALQRLQEAVQYVERSKVADERQVHRLKETLAALICSSTNLPSTKGQVLDRRLMSIAFTKLENEFIRTLSENSNIIPPRGASKPGLPISSHIVHKLQAIVKIMSENGQVDRCAMPYIETRSGMVRESLSAMQTQYLELSSKKVVNMLDWAILESYIGLWTKHIEEVVTSLCASERLLCWKMFASVCEEKRGQYLGEVALEGMTRFVRFGECVAQSEKAPEKLFKLVDMFETLQNLDQSVKEIVSGDGCQDIRNRMQELRKQLAHSACQALRELGSRLELQKEGPVPPDGGILKLSSYVVNYVKYLASEFYSPLMDQLLKIEQSWMVGAASKEGDLSTIVMNIMELLEKTLVARSKAYKDHSLMHIFLLNNLNYIFTRSKSSELGPLLGNYWLMHCRGKVQQQALAYQKEAWGRVLSHLSKDGLFLSENSRVASRGLVKQRLKAFAAALEEACERQRKFTIADAELKEATKGAVIQSVVPAYTNYIQNYGSVLDMEGGRGGSSNKYIKFSPKDVEQMLRNLFQNRCDNGAPANIRANGS